MLAMVARSVVHHALLAEHLRDRQHQVRRRCAFGQAAVELEADDLGKQHVDRLSQHAGLGLDAAHAPAQHPEAVDHGGVAVGAHQRVGIGEHVALVSSQ
jgi:hypothetical protein